MSRRPVFGQHDDPHVKGTIPAAYTTAGVALYKCHRCGERAESVILVDQGARMKPRQLCQRCYYVNTDMGEEFTDDGPDQPPATGTMRPLWDDDAP